MTSPLVEAVVDLGALARNLGHLRRTVAPAELMLVVKADAYGHGRVRTAQQAVASGIRTIGALDVESALDLRANGIGPEIAVLAWLYPPGQGFADAIRARVDLSASSVAEIAAIADAARRVASEPGFAPPRLHLKLDTGLHRNGATAADWPAVVTAAVRAEREGLVRTHAVWTHIAEASDDEDTLSLERFHAGVAVARDLGATVALRHLAASAAGMVRPDVRLDMVRMGGHSWGIPSIDGVTPAELGLTPVMTLRAQVLGTRPGPDGTTLGFVSAGYGDGVPRNVAGACAVAVRGAQHPILQVERDHLVIGATGELAIGDVVTLFGPGADGEQTARRWGDLSGTLGDEIVTRIAARVPRRYVDA
ncbi:alanine racemase [Gryllotalpicola reticulitermitis]|uniref:Alanine racemase n=1 Tax=Gryllotalpicola reticulitermitis TaxID=1184153 RepID=A0ABV8Q913_9MICO